MQVISKPLFLFLTWLASYTCISNRTKLHINTRGHQTKNQCPLKQFPTAMSSCTICENRKNFRCKNLNNSIKLIGHNFSKAKCFTVRFFCTSGHTKYCHPQEFWCHWNKTAIVEATHMKHEIPLLYIAKQGNTPNWSQWKYRKEQDRKRPLALAVWKRMGQ